MVGEHRSSPEIRRLYSTARWRRKREAQLTTQPLCEWCLRQEIVEPASIAHHGEGGHRGDVERFWCVPLVSLCKPCHDRDGGADDRGDGVVRIGLDGYPA